jgi:hypothetical protein
MTNNKFQINNNVHPDQSGQITKTDGFLCLGH